MKTFKLGQNRDVSMHECQVRRVRIGAEQYLLQACLWGRSHLQTYLATTESHHQNAQHCKDVSSFLLTTLPQQVFSWIQYMYIGWLIAQHWQVSLGSWLHLETVELFSTKQTYGNHFQCLQNKYMLLVLWCTNWHLYFVMVYCMNACYTLRNTSIKIGVICPIQLITTKLNGFTKEWSMIGGGDWYPKNTQLEEVLPKFQIRQPKFWVFNASINPLKYSSCSSCFFIFSCHLCPHHGKLLWAFNLEFLNQICGLMASPPISMEVVF